MSIIEGADSVTDTQRKTLLLIHGRGLKPAQDIVLRLWLDALKQGLARDFPDTHQAIKATGQSMKHRKAVTRQSSVTANIRRNWIVKSKD